MRVPKLVIAAFVTVNLLLVAACIFVLRQNARLLNQAADYEALLTPAKGTVVPSLIGRDWTGAEKAIVYGQDIRSTIVYTFSKRCGACLQNWRAMRSLQALAPHHLRIIYIDTLGDLFTSDYLAANGIGQSPLLVQLSPQTALVYDARAVPQLLLMDREGRVQWSHVGGLVPSDVSELTTLIEHE